MERRSQLLPRTSDRFQLHLIPSNPTQEKCPTGSFHAKPLTHHQQRVPANPLPSRQIIKYLTPRSSYSFTEKNLGGTWGVPLSSSVRYGVIIVWNHNVCLDASNPITRLTRWQFWTFFNITSSIWCERKFLLQLNEPHNQLLSQLPLTVIGDVTPLTGNTSPTEWVALVLLTTRRSCDDLRGRCSWFGVVWCGFTPCWTGFWCENVSNYVWSDGKVFAINIFWLIGNNLCISVSRDRTWGQGEWCTIKGDVLHIYLSYFNEL